MSSSLLHRRVLAKSVWLSESFNVLRSLPEQARLALGRRGIWIAIIAAAVGLICFLAALADVTMSLRVSEVANRRQTGVKLLDLDRNFHTVMQRLLAVSSSGNDLRKDDISLQQDWERFEASLAQFCSRQPAPKASNATSVCQAADTLRNRLPSELSVFDPPRRLIAPEVMSQVVMMSALLDKAGDVATQHVDETLDRLLDHYTNALLILAISASGFAAAGLVLIVLVGRTSVLFHAQWRRAGETRDLLQETLEALPAGVVLYDREERLLMFNSVAAELSPVLTRPDAIGTTYQDLVHETARGTAASGDAAQGTPEEWISRFRSKGGSHLRQLADGRWSAWTEKLTPSGRTVGLRVDVTELKRLELEAERSRDEYQSLVDSLSELIFKLDFHTGIFIFVAGAGGSFADVPTDQLLGKSFSAFIASSDIDRVRNVVRAARAANGAMQEVEFLVQLPGGTPRNAEMRFRIIHEGAAEIVSGVIRDVTARTELRERLDSEMARLRAIVESSGALILLTDSDLNVLMVNREFSNFWGVSSDYMVGQSLRGSSTSTGLDSDVHRKWLAGESRDPARFTRTRIDAQGRRRILNVTASPIADDTGLVRQIVFLGVDDTDRIEAEQALFQAERLATVGEMAATIAHEVAQPLQIIELARGSAEVELAEAIAQDRPVDNEYIGERLARIGLQIQRANRLVGDVRAFVRGTSNEVAERFNPVDAVQGAIDLARHSLRQTVVTVSLGMDTVLPHLFGHVGKLEQVLINLINNARDAGAQAIEVFADTKQTDRGKFLRIAVSDNGPGIPSSVLPRLFATFITTKPRGKGTGLGLRICRRIIEEMGGAISASNRPEGGARFEILLPAVD